MSDPKPSLRDALRSLGGAQKSTKGAPAYSVVVNRPLGRALAALAFRLGVTPNTVTLVSAAFTYTGVAILALGRPTWAFGIVVTLLLVVGYGLDAADGQLARLRGGGTLAGEWLDHVVDSGKVASIHLAVAVFAVSNDIGRDWWAVVPLAFTVVAVVSFFGQVLNDLLERTAGVTRDRGGTSESATRMIAKLPVDYGVLCLSFVLLGAPEAFIVLYTVLMLGSLAYLVAALPTWYRRMVAAGSG